jgi:hypothetical protein
VSSFHLRHKHLETIILLQQHSQNIPITQQGFHIDHQLPLFC